MKYLEVLFFYLILFSANAQGYETKFKTDICVCIETKKNTFLSAEKMYTACFSENMVTYAPIIDAQIKEDDKTKKFIAGQKVRRELIEKFKYELIYSCDTYLDIIEEKKWNAIQQFRSKKIDSARIDKLNETVAMQPHWASYFNRGQFYYYIGDFQKAERDILKSIQENPSNQNGTITVQENLLLALIYEEQKQYAKAITIYNTINAKTINPSIELLKAIVYRKSNGYVNKSNTIGESVYTLTTPKEKPQKPPVEINRRTASRTPQTNTDNTNSSQKQTVSKSKDSTKALRKLFKLN